MGIAEEFFKTQVEQIIEVINEDRDEKIVLSKENIDDIVASFLDDDALWQIKWFWVEFVVGVHIPMF